MKFNGSKIDGNRALVFASNWDQPPEFPFLGRCGGGAFVTHHTPPPGGIQPGRKRQPMTVCHGLSFILVSEGTVQEHCEDDARYQSSKASYTRGLGGDKTRQCNVGMVCEREFETQKETVKKNTHKST